MTTKKTKTTQAEHPWTAFMDLVDHVRKVDPEAAVSLAIMPCHTAASVWWTVQSYGQRANVRGDHSNALRAIAAARAQLDKAMAEQRSQIEQARDKARREMESCERALALLPVAKETP